VSRAQDLGDARKLVAPRCSDGSAPYPVVAPRCSDGSAQYPMVAPRCSDGSAPYPMVAPRCSDGSAPYHPPTCSPASSSCTSTAALPTPKPARPSSCRAAYHMDVGTPGYRAPEAATAAVYTAAADVYGLGVVRMLTLPRCMLTRADGKQLCCRPGTAVKLLWPAVNPALA
jgi:serine/threonine protein kinase